MIMRKLYEKNEILSRINSKLIIKEEKLEKIIPLIEKDEANYRLLNEIKNYIKDPKSEIEYVKQSNNILEKLKKQISDVNLWNFKILKTYINNKKLIDFLGFQENEKQEIQKSIKKYESCYINLIFIIISFLILFLVIIIYNQLNKNNNDILYEINWNIFNKSKELVQYENDKYPFEEVLNTLQEILDDGKDIGNLIWEIIKYIKDVLLYKATSIDGSKMDNEKITATYKTLSKRIDSLGVSEPEIVIEGTDKIRVKLAGVKNPEEARTQLSTVATLSFRDSEDNLLMTSDVLEAGKAKIWDNPDKKE